MSSKNIGTEHQAIAVDEFITELAYKLDRFAEELDSYDYQDRWCIWTTISMKSKDRLVQGK